MGQNLQQVLVSKTPEEFQQLVQLYADKKYLIIPDLNNKTIHVALSKGETAEDVILGYYSAVLLGLTACVYNGTYPVSTK